MKINKKYIVGDILLHKGRTRIKANYKRASYDSNELSLKNVETITHKKLHINGWVIYLNSVDPFLSTTILNYKFINSNIKLYKYLLNENK